MYPGNVLCLRVRLPVLRTVDMLESDILPNVLSGALNHWQRGQFSAPRRRDLRKIRCPSPLAESAVQQQLDRRQPAVALNDHIPAVFVRDEERLVLKVPVAGNRQRELVDCEVLPEEANQFRLVQVPVEEEPRIPPIEAELFCSEWSSRRHASARCLVRCHDRHTTGASRASAASSAEASQPSEAADGLLGLHQPEIQTVLCCLLPRAPHTRDARQDAGSHSSPPPFAMVSYRRTLCRSSNHLLWTYYT